MARFTNRADLSPVINAARRWIDRCLIDDESILSSASLWTPEFVEEAREAFVEHSDEGSDDFMTKLKRQMQNASPSAQKLMAEMLWALLEFPSNIKAKTKRQHVRDMWALSGEPLELDQPYLSDSILFGIGSGGPGFNNHRPLELAFLISLTVDLKQKSEAERKQMFSDYDAFIEWIEKVPEKGRRQFRHMLRFFAFPERVERMSANGDRRAVLEAFGAAPEKTTKKWSDRQLDEALLDLRTKLQKEDPSAIIDFYEAPLKAKWKGDDGPAEPESKITRTSEPSDESTPRMTTEPVNLILYGPPGTGKTFWLRQKFAEYTDAAAVVDQETWIQDLLATYGWRPVIAAALADIGRPARVPEIRDHRWVKAKTRQRGLTAASVQAMIWGYLQEHTPETITTVNVRIRRPPFIFSKSESGDWELLQEWQELDEVSAELTRLLKAGPRAARQPIHRYRLVTFHPSFSYEDFVRGIRPVVTEDGTTQFRMADGVFKQICDEAKANPGKRYALFIDEINRANIAKVFGELITLLERDKRAVFDADGRCVDGLTVQLAGGEGADFVDPPFGVPTNLDVYGTMNTADRSIALLDVALRRRFEFREMEPNYSRLDRKVGEVHLGHLLRRINDRLEYLLDRDHRIGHAYLMPAHSIDALRGVFREQIIPLLQEYFFDDFARVEMVLSTLPTENAFIEREQLSHVDLFSNGVGDGVATERSRYVITPELSWTERTFSGVYSSAGLRRDGGDLV